MSPGAVRHSGGLGAKRQEIQMAESVNLLFEFDRRSRPQPRLAQQAGARLERLNKGNAFSTGRANGD